MAVLDRLDVLSTDYESLERTVRAAITDHGESSLRSALREIKHSVRPTTETTDVDQIRATIERLAMLSENLGDRDDPRVSDAFGYLRSLLEDLDEHLNQVVYRRGRDTRAQAVTGVKGRVLAFVRENDGARSGEIASALGIAPAQASRAAAALMAEGRLRLAVPQEDGRARAFSVA